MHNLYVRCAAGIAASGKMSGIVCERNRVCFKSKLGLLISMHSSFLVCIRLNSIRHLSLLSLMSIICLQCASPCSLDWIYKITAASEKSKLGAGKTGTVSIQNWRGGLTRMHPSFSRLSIANAHSCVSLSDLTGQHYSLFHSLVLC